MDLLKRSSHKAGASPGSLQLVSDSRPEEVRISVIDYDEAGVREGEIDTIEDCFPFRKSPGVSWINVTGLDVTTVERLGEHFGIHPLVQEDILHTNQRPKLEDFDDYLFIVLRMLHHGAELKDEQVSLLVIPGCVLSFQEFKGDVFDPLRARIRSGKGRIRRQRADYLAYALVDSVVDHYFFVLEQLGDQIETLEERVINEPENEVLNQIYGLRRRLLMVRHSVWPLREVLNALMRTESALVGDGTKVFLRDVYDHTIQTIDTTEAFREVISGLIDQYLSSISYRMNEVMKFLTLIATIFIPLTFLAGVYGMNFEHMPELSWQWGYFAVWGVMILVGVVLAVVFKRKRWL